MRFAARTQAIEPFRVMQILERARALTRAGRDVVHLEVGEPDFVTAAPIVEAGRRALADGLTGYTEAIGIPELREAVAADYRDRHGIDVAAGRVIITSGASAALTLLAAALVDPGRAVVMADPGYPCNRSFLHVVNGCPLLVPVDAANGYRLRADAIAARWRDDVAGVLVASPANPTGSMLSATDLADVLAAVTARDGFVILDEIYQGLTYDGDRETCPGSGLMGASDADALFVVNSFSKYFGMTGWRLGWMVVPEAAVDPVTRLAQNLMIAPPTVSQHAALAAFSPAAHSEHERRRDAFRERRDRLLEGLRALGFDVPFTPPGAFYLYADISMTGLDAERFCWRLLEEHSVAATPGTDFGRHRAEQHVRFAYTTSVERIDVALERIGSALEAWR